MIELSTKPLTIIFDNVSGVAENLKASDGSVGIRVTREEFSKELCFRFQKPIVSTSANISGEPTAMTFDEISDEIKESVDYIVRYNQRCKEKHKPSSVIKIDSNGEFTIIRD
jgi:L-threonylcarbamoyladenylate synthase